MEKAALESYLQERMGAVTIERIVRSFPGFSRETWLVWFTDGSGVVVRIEPSGGGLVPTPFEFEWKIYETLWRTEIPVAEPLWFDANPDVTNGRPLFVRRLVEGAASIPGLYEDTAEAAKRRRAVAEEHASKLAQLHLLDWKKAGFDEFVSAPAAAADAVRHEFKAWAAIWHEKKVEPSAVVTEALGWLEARLPKSGAALSLCKGNNGIGEEIWRDDKIVAFSDWELASIGDPCYDWAMSQGMMDLWDRDKILRFYEDITGFSLPAENFTFYRVWDIFKSMCVLNSGMNAFCTGENRALARATLGFGKARLFEHLLGRVIEFDTMEDAAAFVVQWRKNPYHDPKITGA